jgi:hypothetical protein
MHHPEVVFIVPGIVTVMTPPHVHMHLLGDVRAGRPPMVVRVATGVHGPVGTGTHGCGVSTPRAAVVADATVGLASDVHIPNGGMFAPGSMSETVAAGLPSMSTRLVGMTFSVDGATPKLHDTIAVAVTFGEPTSLLSFERASLPSAAIP